MAPDMLRIEQRSGATHTPSVLFSSRGMCAGRLLHAT